MFARKKSLSIISFNNERNQQEYWIDRILDNLIIFSAVPFSDDLSKNIFLKAISNELKAW